MEEVERDVSGSGKKFKLKTQKESVTYLLRKYRLCLFSFNQMVNGQQKKGEVYLLKQS